MAEKPLSQWIRGLPKQTLGVCQRIRGLLQQIRCMCFHPRRFVVFRVPPSSCPAFSILQVPSSFISPLEVSKHNPTMMKCCSALTTVLAALVGSASAFSQSSEQMSRRNALLSGAAAASAALLGPNVASAGETRQGVELTPFNSLAFQYRNSQNEIGRAHV